MDLVGRNSLKVPFSAMKDFVLYKKPDLSFKDIIDLLGLMSVGSRMVSWSPGSNHQATFIAVRSLDDHRALSLIAGPDDLSLRNVFRCDV
jgi:hypothetical protein